MKFTDTFAMGARSLRERPLETGLIILGIALSACVASASLLLLGSQSAETERLLQGPAYREIVVTTENGNGPDSGSALREITQTARENISFTDNDVQTILASTPQVRYSYKASTDNIRINGFGGPGGMPGGMPGAQAAAATPATGTTPAASAAAIASPEPAASASAASTDTSSAAVTLNAKGKLKVAKNKSGTSSAASDAASPAASPDASPAASAAPDQNAGPPDGGPFGPQANMPQASVAEGETLLTTELTEFRNMQVSPDFFQAYGVQVAKGNLFTDSDSQKNAAYVVLGELAAAKLFPDIEPLDLVGRKIRLENRIWEITGILSSAANNITLSNGSVLGDMSFTPILEIVFRNGDQVIRINRGNSSLRFAVADSKDLAQAYASLNSYFETTYGIGKVRITVPFDEARLSRDGFNRLLWLIVAFGIGALLMALINLMNMMLTRALRRQAILGILGAMGASQGDLTKLQTVEGGLMAAAGSLLGIGLSLPFYSVLYNAGKNLFGISGGQALLDPVVLAITAPMILLIGLILALIPAWQSSNTPITMALRSE